MIILSHTNIISLICCYLKFLYMIFISCNVQQFKVWFDLTDCVHAFVMHFFLMVANYYLLNNTQKAKERATQTH